MRARSSSRESIDLLLTAASPIENLQAWLTEACFTPTALPEAVCLATVSPEGAPSARMVLFKGIDAARLLFFTDYRSRKAKELDHDPRAAMVFYWQALGRQIRVEGEVERLPDAASDGYFMSRSRGSRLSAWASTQSGKAASRRALERLREEVEERFRDREVTRPEHWGGFALSPSRIEFWLERDDRFHDRVVYERSGAGWTQGRLQP